MKGPRQPRGPRSRRGEHRPTTRAGRINWHPSQGPKDQAPWEKPQTAAPAATPEPVQSAFAPRIDARASGLGDLPAITPSDQPEFLPPSGLAH